MGEGVTHEAGPCCATNPARTITDENKGTKRVTGNATAEVAGRWGGVEFDIRTAVATAAHPRAPAERLRALVAVSHVPHEGGQFHVTVSAGATLARFGATREQPLARVDSLMDASRRDGRNRVTIDGDG